MNARSTIAAAAVLTALAAPAAAQARNLPVGSHNGIAIKVGKKTTAVRFTARAAALYKTVAGQEFGVGCSSLFSTTLGPTVTRSKRTTVRAPKRRRPLTAKFTLSKPDVCTVTRGRTVRVIKGKRVVSRAKVIARVPITQLGARFVSELEAMAPLKVVSQLANRFVQVRGQFPTVAQLNTYGGEPFRRYHLTALSSPQTPVAPNATGYYTNGSTATLARTASTGRRMFVTVTADGQLSSNGIVYIAYYT